MSFVVRWTEGARQDLVRLYEHLLDRVADFADLERAADAIDAITDAAASLERSPFLYRKVTGSPFLRELIIPFGANGYVALYEIDNASTVTILAVRHQLEEDYH